MANRDDAPGGSGERVAAHCGGPFCVAAPDCQCDCDRCWRAWDAYADGGKADHCIEIDGTSGNRLRVGAHGAHVHVAVWTRSRGDTGLIVSRPDALRLAAHLHRLAGAPQARRDLCETDDDVEAVRALCRRLGYGRVAQIAQQSAGAPQGQGQPPRLVRDSECVTDESDRERRCQRCGALSDAPHRSYCDLPSEPTQGPGRDGVERCPYCGDGRESRSGGRIHRVSRDHLTRCRTQRWWSVYLHYLDGQPPLQAARGADAAVRTAAEHMRGEGSSHG